MKTLIFSLLAIFGSVSGYAGTVHAGHMTVHRGATVHTGGNYHRNNYRGNCYGGYHGGHGYYADGGHTRRYWRGGYYGGRYYGPGYY